MTESGSLWAEAAIEQNRRWLTAYVLSATGDRSACDDMVQEVFTVAYKKRSSFQVGTNFGGWLRVIARNVIRRHFEKRARQPLFSHDDAMAALDQVAVESEENSCDPFFMERRKGFLRECLGKITDRVRQLMSLRYMDRKPSEEIARLLGMTVSAVDVAAFRARLALGECIQRKEETAKV